MHRRRLGAPVARLSAAIAMASLLAIGPAAASGSTFTSTEHGIAVEPGNQVDPSISGQYVVFTDLTADGGDIWYYNRADGSLHLAVGGAGDQILADVSGASIAYTDFALGTGEIYLYDIAGGTKLDVSNNPGSTETSPALSDNLVAWEDMRGGDVDIWVYDRLTSSAASITGAGDQVQPAVSGTRVAYVDGNAGLSVVVYDASTATRSTVFGGPADLPDIDGNHVAFTNLGGADENVEVYDLVGGTTTALVLPGDQGNAHISGNWVSFEDYSSGNAHVGLWNWVTGDVFYPTPNTSIQSLNDIDGSRVVYTDNRSGDLDIYALDFTYSTGAVLAAQVQQPINADGSSVFSAKRGVVPVKFTLTSGGSPTCSLPPATIAVTRTAGGTLGSIDESTYTTAADSGPNFRIDATTCQYVYNLSAAALGPGSYRVDILISGSPVGSATFALK